MSPIHHPHTQREACYTNTHATSGPLLSPFELLLRWHFDSILQRSGIDLCNCALYSCGRKIPFFGSFFAGEKNPATTDHPNFIFGSIIQSDWSPRWKLLETTDDHIKYNIDSSEAFAWYKEQLDRMASPKIEDVESVLFVLSFLAMKLARLMVTKIYIVEMACFKNTKSGLSNIFKYKGLPIPPPHYNLNGLEHSFQPSKVLDKIPDALLEYMNFEQISSEFGRLANALKMAQKDSATNEPRVVTGSVARIFDSKCLVELSAANNPIITLTCALLKRNGHPFWNTNL